MSVWGNDWMVNTRALAAGYDDLMKARDAAQQGVDAASAGANAMRRDAASMRGQAQLVNTQAGRVNQSADALAALAPKLAPYAAKLGGYGDDLAALGRSLTEQANDVFGQGGALVNLDPTKGGLSAEFIKQYGYLSPDRYVSRAASDVQGAFANAEGQMGRQNARRGVAAGSGAAMALRQKLGRDLAVALAAAKMNASQQGIDEQTKMLSTMTNAANTLYNMGSQTQSQATAALGAAGDAQKSAAGVVQAQGNLLGDAGQLRATAGSLFSNAASIFGNAAGVEGSATKLGLDALANLQSAWSNAAQYYQTVAMGELSADTTVRAAELGAPVQVTNNYKIDNGGNAVPA